VSLEIFAPDDTSFVMRISDTGKGIPEEDQPYIFSPFYQSKHTLDDGQPGTGLGLALADEMLKVYQGKIALHSAVNQGTIIIVTIPVQWHEIVSAEAGDTPAYPNRNVVLATEANETAAASNVEVPEEDSRDVLLVVEDNRDVLLVVEDNRDVLLVVEDNRDLREFIVSVFSEQFSVVTATDGEAGLAAAIRHIPDIIISDVMMPVMDGVSLVDSVKSDERTSHIPIVLLTAKADAESRMQGLKNGADDYLSKPFSVEELRIRVENLVVLRRKLMLKFKMQIGTLSEPRAAQSLDEKFLWKVKEQIEEHIADADFGVEQLASEMFMSRSQLFRKFKALMDTSPSEYINDLRLEKAEKLIAARADTVSQISYAVGFKDQSYFAKRFRKKYGKSPSEYADSV
jgi:DNA-binding response OmpR family regulator